MNCLFFNHLFSWDPRCASLFMVALQPLVNASNVWQGCFLPDDAKKGDADRRLFESLIRLRHLAYWIGMATRQAGRGPRDSRRQAWYRGPSPESESCAAKLETGQLPLFRSNHRKWPERCAIPWSKDVSAEQRSPTPRSIVYDSRIVRSFAVRNRQSHCFQGQFHQSFSGFDLRRQVLPVPRWFGSRYIQLRFATQNGRAAERILPIFLWNVPDYPLWWQ